VVGVAGVVVEEAVASEGVPEEAVASEVAQVVSVVAEGDGVEVTVGVAVSEVHVGVVHEGIVGVAVGATEVPEGGHHEADTTITHQGIVTAAEMGVAVVMVGHQVPVVDQVDTSDRTIEVGHPSDVEAAEIMGANHHTAEAVAAATVAKIVVAVITVAERTTGATEEGAMPTIPQDTKHHAVVTLSKVSHKNSKI